MGLLAWVILLAVSAVLATAAQFVLFPHDRETTDYDWIYVAGGIPALVHGPCLVW